MEDVLTEIPPPSRFSEDDLNNFTPPLPPLPSPFLVFPNPGPLRPSLLIVAVSSPSLYVLHHFPQKTLIGSLILPEIPFSGNSIEPSLRDKSCHIYALNGAESSILLVSVQCPVSQERAHAVSRKLVGEKIVPERVLVLDSIQRRNFRGRVLPEDAFAFRLETSAERKAAGDSCPLKGLAYFPAGSVVVGLSAALLSRCETRKIRGTVCVTWPEVGGPAVSLVKSLLKSVLPGSDFSNDGGEYSRSGQGSDRLFDSELYT